MISQSLSDLEPPGGLAEGVLDMLMRSPPNVSVSDALKQYKDQPSLYKEMLPLVVQIRNRLQSQCSMLYARKCNTLMHIRSLHNRLAEYSLGDIEAATRAACGDAPSLISRLMEREYPRVWKHANTVCAQYKQCRTMCDRVHSIHNVITTLSRDNMWNGDIDDFN